MKKILYGISITAMSAIISTSAFAAEKVLTVASWAAPFHTQNENFFPWMNDQLNSCTGGSLSLKVEYGLAPPPALYDSIRDESFVIGEAAIPIAESNLLDPPSLLKLVP